MPKVLLSHDRLEAFLVLETGETIAPVEAWAMLARAGVFFGVSAPAVLALETMVGPAEHLVAVGEQPVHGQDAEIHYHFRTTPASLAPAIGPDGQADYRALNLIDCVAAGQLLATRLPPRVGKDGFSVCGERLVAMRPRNRLLKAGEGARLSPDENAVVATTPGSPSLEGGAVTVRNSYRVNGRAPAQAQAQFDHDWVQRGVPAEPPSALALALCKLYHKL